MTEAAPCHCGEPAWEHDDKDDPYGNRGMCRACDIARCDTFPARCPEAPREARAAARESEKEPTPGDGHQKSDALVAEDALIEQLRRNANVLLNGFGVHASAQNAAADALAAAQTRAAALRAENERLQGEVLRVHNLWRAATETDVVKALQGCVVGAYEYGTQDGEFVAAYVTPTGPIHRAIPVLQALGIVARPRAQEVMPPALVERVQGEADATIAALRTDLAAARDRLDGDAWDRITAERDRLRSELRTARRDALTQEAAGVRTIGFILATLEGGRVSVPDRVIVDLPYDAEVATWRDARGTATVWELSPHGASSKPKQD